MYKVVGSWGATRATRMGCLFDTLDIWLPQRSNMLIPVLISYEAGGGLSKGQSEVSCYTENASPKDGSPISD